MNNAKIQFSEKELNLAGDIDVILTKNRIIEKVYNLFGSLADTYIQLAGNTLPPDILSKPPKISRGENYNALPYVMLDYPRFFSKQDVFAIRTMFWWGNDLSFTLHLKGRFRNEYQASLQHLDQHKERTWYLQLSENEWLHHKAPQTHENMADLSLSVWEDYGRENDFIKIACFHPLQQWNTAADIFEKDFAIIMKMLGNGV